MDLLFLRGPNRIFRLRKRAASVILSVDMRSRTADNYKKLDWIPFYDEVMINKCVTVHRILVGH